MTRQLRNILLVLLTGALLSAGWVIAARAGQESAPASPTAGSDLIISKQVEFNSLPRGGVATYLIDYVNNGVDAAIGALITDTLPDGVIYFYTTGAPEPQVFGRQLVWQVPIIPPAPQPGSSGAIQVHVIIPQALAAGQVITNTVDAWADNETNFGTNHFVTANAVQAPRYNLALAKHPYSPLADFRIGALFEYQIEATNTGNQFLSNVVITDTLPAGLVYDPFVSVEDPPGWTRTVSGQQVTWKGGLNIGQQVFLHVSAFITIEAAPGTLVTNRVSGSTGQQETILDDNYAELTLPLLGYGVDLSIGKTWAGGSRVPGKPITYRLNYINLGDTPAFNVVIYDTFPVEMSLLKWYSSESGVWTKGQDGNFLVFDRGQLPLDPGASGWIEIELLTDPRVQDGAILANQATITSDASDSNPDNNAAYLPLMFTTQDVDLAVQKIPNGGLYIPGGDYFYTILFSNLGNTLATGVLVTDTLPLGLEFVSSDIPPVQVLPLQRQVVWDVREIPGGGSGQINLTVRSDPGLSPGTLLCNQAQIGTTSLETGQVSNTAKHCQELQPPLRDLRINYFYGPAPAPGTVTGYWVGFDNIGNAPANLSTFTYTLPPGATFSGWYGYMFSPGYINLAGVVTPTLQGNQVVWANLPELVVGGYGYIHLDLLVSENSPVGAPFDSRAEIASPLGDVYPQNNSMLWKQTIVPSVVDLSISKYSGTANPLIGEAITYHLMVTNTSFPESNLPFAPAHNVVVTDTLPAGTSLISASASQGGCNLLQGKVICGLGRLALYETANITISLSSAVSGWITNTASTAASEQDMYTLDNTSRYPIPVLAPSLRVNYTDDIVTLNYAAGHTAWITVTNQAQTTILGTYSGLTFPFGGYTSSGAVSGLTTNIEGWVKGKPDIQPFDWVLVRTDDGFVRSLHVGELTGLLDSATDSITGTLNVPWLTGNLLVECQNNFYPTWFKNSFASTTGTTPYSCAWDPFYEWDVLPGQSALVAYYEPDGDAVTARFEQPLADVYVTKQASTALAMPGGNVHFKITYSNQGTLPAESVILQDILPSGTSYLADNSGLPTGPGTSTVNWSVGTLQPGEQHTFDLYLAVDAGFQPPIFPWSLVNEVNISTTSLELVTFNNNAQAAFFVDYPNAWLRVSKDSRTYNPAPGNTFVYKLFPCNFGTTTSALVDLVDNLPRETTLMDWWSDTPGWFETDRGPQLLILRNLAVEPLAGCPEISVRVALDAGVAAGTPITNTVTINSATGVDPQFGQAQKVLLVGDPQPNLHLEKIAEPSIQTPGGELRYHVRLINDGNIPFTQKLFLKEQFPLGTTFMDATMNNGQALTPDAQGPGYVIFALNGLENGFAYDIFLRLSVAANIAPGALLENSVQVQPVPGELNLADNTAVAAHRIFPHGPNLAVTKTGGWDGATSFPQSAWYEMTVYNIGDEPVDSVVVTDTYPADFYLSNTPKFDPRFLLGWQDNSIAHQYTANFTGLLPGEGFLISTYYYNRYEVVPSGLVFTNTVDVNQPPGDIYVANNHASYELTSGPELSLLKAYEAGIQKPGEVITFSLQVANVQTPAAHWWQTQGNVLLTDTLPAGLTFLGAVETFPCQGCPLQPLVNAGGQVVFDLGQFSAGAGKQILLSAQIAANLPNQTLLINQASVGTTMPFNDIEAYKNNNTASASVLVTTNAAPVAANDIYTITQNTILNIPAPGVLANDSDAEGDPFIALLASKPQFGFIQLNPDGSFVYAPPHNFVGEDTFTYQAKDASGVSNLATVLIRVSPQEQDLFSFEWELRAKNSVTGLQTLFAGDPVQVALKVFRQGGTTNLANLKVAFFAGATPLGLANISVMTPNSAIVTLPVLWTPNSRGSLTLRAVIDPTNQVPESDEQNNLIERVVTVYQKSQDLLAPVITGVTIDNTPSITPTLTSDLQVGLKISASDIGSGVDSYYIMEFVYSNTLNTWAPVAFSGWTPYPGVSTTFPYTLYDQPGIHFLLFFVSDNAGNISAPFKFARVNYNPPSAEIGIGEGHIFRLRLKAGETLRLTLNSSAGDADLYVWGPPNSNFVGASYLETSPDVVEFTAAITGYYQVEVIGYTAATYSLLVEKVPLQPTFRPGPTPLPKGISQSLTGASDEPESSETVEPQATIYDVYLPAISR